MLSAAEPALAFEQAQPQQRELLKELSWRDVNNAIAAHPGGMSHAAISELFDCSKEQIRQIEIRAMARMAARIQSMSFDVGFAFAEPDSDPFDSLRRPELKRGAEFETDADEAGRERVESFADASSVTIRCDLAIQRLEASAHRVAIKIAGLIPPDDLI